MDPTWGHVTIKMSGHPPFGAQVILNGHEYVACAARAAGIGFTKEGNCFTAVEDPQALARVADTLSHPAAVGRLSQVCDRWIYSACLCFGLDLDEQERSSFRYSLLRLPGRVQPQPGLSGRRPDGAGLRQRSSTGAGHDWTSPLCASSSAPSSGPASRRNDLSPRVGIVIETPRHDLSVFKVHFGLLTLKAYTKGEHVLRFEAIVHNTRTLRTGRVLERFPDIVTRLGAMVERFCTALDCVDVGFIPDGTLDQLPLPSLIGATRVGGIDLNKPRIRRVLAAVLALSASPGGFTVGDLATRVQALSGTDYTVRQAAYDLRKLRGKELVVKPGRSRRYHVPPDAARTIDGPASPAGSGHRPNPRRMPGSEAGTKAEHLDRHRRSLRGAAPGHGWPSSMRSASQPEPPRHRQPFVDEGTSSAYRQRQFSSGVDSVVFSTPPELYPHRAHTGADRSFFRSSWADFQYVFQRPGQLLMGTVRLLASLKTVPECDSRRASLRPLRLRSR